MMTRAIVGQSEDIFLAAWFDRGGREEIAQGSVIHQSFFSVGENSKVRFDQILVN